MSENYSSLTPVVVPRRWFFWRSIALVAWVIIGFILATLLVVLVSELLVVAGVQLDTLNKSVVNAAAAGVVYVLSATIVIGLPQVIGRLRTNRTELGVARLPSWQDMALAPAAYLIYMVATAMVMGAVILLVPGFDTDQAQDVGFTNLTLQYEYILAFLTLVVLAPIAEELLFRGYLYGKLRRWLPIWLAAIITSVVFGLVHGQWNVGLDVFVLSLVMCGLREMTGSIWAGVLLHMLKNGLAFYLLFINPSLLTTIGV